MAGITKECRRLDNAVRILFWVFLVFSLFFLFSAFAESRLIINGRLYVDNVTAVVVQVNASDVLNPHWLNDSGNPVLNGSLNVTGTGFFSYLGSSLSKIAVGWFGWIYADNINATNITGTNLYGSLNASDIYDAQWLLITDQRYNDSLLVQAVNASLQQEILYRLANDSFLSSQIASVNGSLFLMIQNVNSSLVLQIASVNASLQQEILDRIANDSFLQVEIDAVNASLAGYLLIGDQRYNDSLLVQAVNASLQQEILDRIANDSFLQGEFDALNLSALKNSGDQILNGNLLVNGNFSVVGSVVNLTVENAFTNGSIIPTIDSFFDLGSPTAYWDIVYANTVYGTVNASQIANSYWLVESDQRYNDTLFILNELMNYYNMSQIDAMFQNYYNQSEVDALIAGVNVTTYITNNITNNITQNITYYIENNITNNITQNITIYINETYNDSALQAKIDAINNSLYLYNDTGYIDSLLLNYYNKTEIDALLPAYNETGLIYALLMDYYNKTEIDALLPAYNDTGYIDSLLLNFYNKSEVDYLLDQKLNTTDQRYNNTIRLFVINISVSAIGGNASYNTSNLTNFAIKQIIVTPTTSSNSYQFLATEYPVITNIIDRNRVVHNETWNIQKDYAINSAIQVSVFNASIDEAFNIVVKYINNDAP